MMKIGIIYLSTGIYNTFWDGFYQSVNKFFCTSSTKNFYLFTDDPILASKQHPDNVHSYLIEDQGWVANILRRSELFLSIKEQLMENDFLFNLNSNYRAIAPIEEYEVIPTESNDWLCGLSFDFYQEQHPDTYAYERNSQSKAYIPFGDGRYYFQGGFYGGKVNEFLEMSQWIKEQTDIDIAQNIIPIYHDESYVNRYFCERNPLIIGTQYAKAEQWRLKGDFKGIILDKDKFFGKEAIANLKSYFSQPNLKFLTDSNMKTHPIGIINLYGGLGNQMFQYGLLLTLSRKFPDRKFYLNMESLFSLEHHKGYQLNEIFGVPDTIIADKEQIEQINRVPEAYKRYIREEVSVVYTPIEDSTHPVWILSGYWQSEKYLDEPVSIRKYFRFNESIFTDYNKKMLVQIRQSHQSVGIHVRRGDYTKHIRTYHLMGGICTAKYYASAAKLFDPNATFFIFSDDIEWCKEYIKFPNTIYVSQESSENDWQDMALMSVCNHQIIANSSFSWWAAWLNDYPDKKVITPHKWYNTMNDIDIIPESWQRINQPSDVYEFADLTIVFPVRIDSQERLRNLYVVLRQLSTMDGLKVIVLEADLISKIKLPENVRKVFIEDSDPIFHRTKYINILCSLTDTQYMGIWDTDVIIPLPQIREAISSLRRNESDMIYPYDGRFYHISGSILEEFLKSEDVNFLTENIDRLKLTYIHHSCGGAFMVNKKAYEAAGGENEKFYGWGPEDLERYKRWEIKGYRVANTQGALFHLEHPRGENSWYYNKESKKALLKVLLETCRE